MRYLVACMLLCLGSGYAQDSEDPIVTTEDSGESQEVAIDDSLFDWGCGCGKKGKGGK